MKYFILGTVGATIYAGYTALEAAQAAFAAHQAAVAALLGGM